LVLGAFLRFYLMGMWSIIDHFVALVPLPYPLAPLPQAAIRFLNRLSFRPRLPFPFHFRGCGEGWAVFPIFFCFFYVWLLLREFFCFFFVCVRVVAFFCPRFPLSFLVFPFFGLLETPSSFMVGGRLRGCVFLVFKVPVFFVCDFCFFFFLVFSL